MRKLVLILLVVLSAVSCGKPKRISKGEMAQIYAEMFLADQWINDNNARRAMADTSLVYEPIFNRYGYTSRDYLYSLDYYMTDPESFEKVFRETKDILQDALDSLTYDRRMADLKDSVARARAKMVYPESVTFDDLMTVPHGWRIHVGTDSLGKMILLPDEDTVFAGPAKIARELVWEALNAVNPDSLELLSAVVPEDQPDQVLAKDVDWIELAVEDRKPTDKDEVTLSGKNGKKATDKFINALPMRPDKLRKGQARKSLLHPETDMLKSIEAKKLQE